MGSTSDDDATWQPPDGRLRRVGAVADGLVILTGVTVAVCLVGWIFAGTTPCAGECDRRQFVVGALVITVVPLAASLTIGVITLVRALTGRRPQRLWMFGVAFVGLCFLLGIDLMDRALP